jgi:cob(I)alamin adenosyltransferase
MKLRHNPMAASITTRVGDKGSTFLFSGERVSKDSPRTEAYGDLDELVSVLGLARVHARRTRRQAMELQRELFVVGAELATSPRHLRLLKQRVDEHMVQELERRRSRLERAITMPAGFIIPGGTPGGAHLDHARTIARRIERKVVGLHRKRLVRNPHLLVWLNRLSDYLWLLARREEGRRTMEKD